MPRQTLSVLTGIIILFNKGHDSVIMHSYSVLCRLKNKRKPPPVKAQDIPASYNIAVKTGANLKKNRHAPYFVLFCLILKLFKIPSLKIVDKFLIPASNRPAVKFTCCPDKCCSACYQYFISLKKFAPSNIPFFSINFVLTA